MQEDRVVIDQAACIGCGVCVAMCPQQILYLDEKTNKCMVSDQQKCDRLKGCMRACPVQAITIK